MFKKVSTQRTYYKYKDCTPGQKLVEAGAFIGTEEGKFGVQHVFKEPSRIVCLNSAGHLNYLIENHVKPGMLCNVVYAEKSKISKGTFAGKEAHRFELEIDDTPVKEAPKAPSADVPLDDLSL